MQTESTMEQIENVEVIQRFWRRKQIQRSIKNMKFDDKYKKLKKTMIYRRHVISELVSTEANYVRDLKAIMDGIICPIEQQQLLDKQTIKEAFINIQQILGLNESILEVLKDSMQRLEGLEKTTQMSKPYFIFFNEFVTIIPFFKMYYEYSQNFEKSGKVRLKLKQTNRAYSDFIAQVKRSPMMRGLDLEDLLVKPIQRLPKYLLLLKDLFKHTMKDHPDYDNIHSSLEQFEKINNENNQYINELLMFYKMAELQKLLQHSKHKKKIIKSNRKFVMEEAYTLYNKLAHQQQEVLCYFLTDLIVVTERVIEKSLSNKPKETKYKITKLIYLKYNSVVRSVHK